MQGLEESNFRPKKDGTFTYVETKPALHTKYWMDNDITIPITKVLVET